MTGRPADELVAAGFAWEAEDAPALHDALNLVDLAHAVFLAEHGIVPATTRAVLLGALLDLTRLSAGEVDYTAVRGEPYLAREHHLAARIGDQVGWLRAGRTRREAVRTAWRLTLRSQVLDLIDAATGLAAALADQGERHLDTLMPDHTYLQHAQPTTFGHYLLSFADPLLRDAERLLAEFATVNASPAGAGAANGSSVITDRHAYAHTLGFDRAVEHIRDAMWQTDPFLHVLTTAASLLLTQDRLAEDLEIFASAEFGYLELADGYSRASVLMPQKRNPYALTVIRGSTGVVLGRLAGQTAVTKAPSARSDTLIYLHGELYRALDLTIRVTRLTAGVVGTLTAYPDRMVASLGLGFFQATDLAELLMRRFGTNYRTAHDVVSRAVRGPALDAGAIARAAAEVTGHAWALDDAELRRALDPQTLVASRTAVGGAAVAAMRPMLDRARRQAADLSARAAARRETFRAAEAAILTRATAIAEATDTGRVP